MLDEHKDGDSTGQPSKMASPCERVSIDFVIHLSLNTHEHGSMLLRK